MALSHLASATFCRTRKRNTKLTKLSNHGKARVASTVQLARLVHFFLVSDAPISWSGVSIKGFLIFARISTVAIPDRHKTVSTVLG